MYVNILKHLKYEKYNRQLLLQLVFFFDVKVSLEFGLNRVRGEYRRFQHLRRNVRSLLCEGDGVNDGFLFQT